MEAENLKKIIDRADKQIGWGREIGPDTAFSLLEAARDYLWSLKEPSNKVDTIYACVWCQRNYTISELTKNCVHCDRPLRQE